MGTLHLLAFPPTRTDLLAQLHACLGPNDVLVLVEAGAALAGPGRAATAARAQWGALPCHVLGSDLDALGITAASDVLRSDWDAVAALTEQLPRTLSWWP